MTTTRNTIKLFKSTASVIFELLSATVTVVHYLVEKDTLFLKLNESRALEI